MILFLLLLFLVNADPKKYYKNDEDKTSAVTPINFSMNPE